MGGLGERLGIDPVVLRIVTAVLALFGGAGVLIYAIAWLLVPADNEAGSVLDQALGRVEPRQSNAGPLALGLGLAALISAGFVVGGSVVSGPLLLGAAAAGYLLLRRRDEQADADHAEVSSVGDRVSRDLPRSWPSYAPQADDESGGDDRAARDFNESPDLLTDELTDSDSDEPATSPTPDPAAANLGSAASNTIGGTGWPDGPDWTPPPSPPSDDARWAVPDPGEPAAPGSGTKHRSPLGALTFSAALIAVGVLAIVDTSTNFPFGLYFAVPLAVIGLGLVIGSWFGRSRGLIALGIVLALALIPATAASNWDGEFGRQSYYRATTPADLPPDPVNIGGGQVTYDLAMLDLKPTDDVALSIEMGAGDLTILVPREADIEVDASLGIGDLIVRTAQSSGVGSKISQTFDGEGTDGGTIELNIDMAAGSVKVVNGR